VLKLIQLLLDVSSLYIAQVAK